MRTIAAFICALLTATAALAQSPTSTTGAAATRAPQGQRVTVIGCVAKDGATEHDKGTRQLNTTPGGFALLSARPTMIGNGTGSAVPGSVPAGSDTGTIPQQGSVVGRQTSTDGTGYALSGKTEGLANEIGRRVEIIGFVTATSASRSDESMRGTSGRTTSADSGTGTREERAPSAVAHPSAELQPLEVVSFRPVTGICE